LRTFRDLLLVALLCAATSSPLIAQAGVTTRTIPITLSLTVPLGQPPEVTAGSFATQAAFGALGGIAGVLVVGLPFMVSGREQPPNDSPLMWLLGGAYVGGIVAGVHYAGHRQGMRGNPWGTGGGVLAGFTLAGALMQPFVDDEGELTGPAPLIALILPGVGGAVGYTLTRRAR
jgi:hypothetical protein